MLGLSSNTRKVLKLLKRDPRSKNLDDMQLLLYKSAKIAILNPHKTYLKRFLREL